MNPARVASRGLRVLSAEAAALKDYRLLFDKVAQESPGAGHANLVRAPGERAEGVLYELIDAAEILKMDPFERAPINYGREAVLLETGTGARWAWTYFANQARRADGLKPPASYLAHLLAGSDYLSPDYRLRLEALESLPG